MVRWFCGPPISSYAIRLHASWAAQGEKWIQMANSSDERLRVGRSPIILPIAVSLWAFIVPILVITLSKISNGKTDFLSTHSFVIDMIGQLLIDLPAVILFARTQNKPENEIGVQSKTRFRVMSAIVGMVCGILLAALRLLAIGHLMGGGFMGGIPAFTQSFRFGKSMEYCRG